MVDKFTRGPWKHGHMGDAETIWIGPDYDQTPVAYVDRDRKRGRDEHNANAQLIATAPEILGALEIAVALIESAERETNWCSGDPYGDSAVVELRAVIAKATNPRK